MTRTTERWYPVVTGGIGAALALSWHLLYGVPVILELRDLMSTAVNISAIAIGFLGAVLSILLAVSDRYTIRELRRIGYFRFVIEYIMWGINWSLALAIVSGVVILVGLGSHWLHGLLAAAWLFCGLTAATSIYRIITIFANILRADEPAAAVSDS